MRNRVVDHPAVDDGHQLIAIGRGQQAIEGDSPPGLVEHAAQQLEVRLRTDRMRKGRNELRVQAQMSRIDGLAQLAGDVDIREPSYEARIIALIGLDPVAAPVLRGLAGGLGRGQRMHQLAVAGSKRRHTYTDRSMQARIAVHRAELFDALAQRLGKLLCGFQRHRQQHGEAVARDTGCKCVGGQSRTDELAQLGQHSISHVHAEAVVDHVELIGVYIDGSPLHRLAGIRGDDTHPLFEGGSGVQPAQSSVRQQRFAILVERRHRPVESFNRSARHEVAPQTLQRGTQQRQGE